MRGYPILLSPFFDFYLIVGINSNAGQMRDAENLAVARKLREVAADGNGDFSADSRIDFIEHERGNRIDPRKQRFEREHDARQFAAGGNPRKRQQSGAGIRANEKFNIIHAVGAAPLLNAVALFFGNADGKTRALHAEIF